MRWVIAIFVLVTLIVMDQSWYRGRYMSAAARMLREIFASLGL